MMWPKEHGAWGQMATPLTVALAAGAFFPSTLLAASVPLAAITVSNLFMPPYEHPLMACIVYAALTWPILIGRCGLLGAIGRRTRWANVVGGATVLLFEWSNPGTLGPLGFVDKLTAGAFHLGKRAEFFVSRNEPFLDVGPLNAFVAGGVLFKALL